MRVPLALPNFPVMLIGARNTIRADDMTITELKLEEETLGRIDKLATAIHRDRTWVMHKAIQRYLDSEEWFVSSAPAGTRTVIEDH